MASNIFERVAKLLVDQLGIKQDEIKPESHLVDDLGTDSLDIVEVFMAIEEEFGTEIPDETAEKLVTVQNIIDYISANVST